LRRRPRRDFLDRDVRKGVHVVTDRRRSAFRIFRKHESARLDRTRALQRQRRDEARPRANRRVRLRLGNIFFRGVSKSPKGPPQKTRRESEKRRVHRSVVACRRGLVRARSRPGFEARRWRRRPQAFVGERRGVRGVRGVRGLPRSVPLRGFVFQSFATRFPRRRRGFIRAFTRAFTRGAARLGRKHPRVPPLASVCRRGVRTCAVPEVRVRPFSVGVRKFRRKIVAILVRLGFVLVGLGLGLGTVRGAPPPGPPRRGRARGPRRDRARRVRPREALGRGAGQGRVGNAGGSRGDALLRARGGRPRGLGRCGVGREAHVARAFRGTPRVVARRQRVARTLLAEHAAARAAVVLPGHQAERHPALETGFRRALVYPEAGPRRAPAARAETHRVEDLAHGASRAGDFLGHARPARVTASWSYRSAP
jgi:hypothetical protein